VLGRKVWTHSPLPISRIQWTTEQSSSQTEVTPESCILCGQGFSAPIGEGGIGADAAAVPMKDRLVSRSLLRHHLWTDNTQPILKEDLLPTI
jgi:hypothetical protein